jgi:transcriptional regulator GlxA family with amidase domain
LGALRDAQIGRAIELLHGDLKREWTMEMLAREVGLSRATLGRRFVALVGKPPMNYLAQLRIDAAARLLRQTTRPLAAIAAEVGYDSEYAFNRAFKRVRRVAPGTYRRDASRVTVARDFAGGEIPCRPVQTQPCEGPLVAS